jgi:hypothetical protein
MKKLLLIGALVCGMYADALAGQSTPPQTPVATELSGSDLLDYYYEELMPYVGPFSYGFMIGAVTGGFESEVVNPVVSWLLKGWNDMFVVGVELGVMGGAGYLVYKDQSNEETVFAKPASLVGVLAGIIAWYNIHG